MEETRLWYEKVNMDIVRKDVDYESSKEARKQNPSMHAETFTSSKNKCNVCKPLNYWTYTYIVKVLNFVLKLI